MRHPHATKEFVAQGTTEGPVAFRGASYPRTERASSARPPARDYLPVDDRLTQLVAVTGIFFLAILLGLTMIDYGSRSWVNPPALLQ